MDIKVIENFDSKLTTHEKVELLIKNQKEILEKIDSVEPANLQFGDGSTVSTQSTRAEDIVSVEDQRLEAQRNADQAQQAIKDGEQDTSILSNEGRIDVLEPKVSDNELDILDHESRITTNEQDIDSIELVNTNQDERLTVLEGAVKTTTRDYSLLEDSGSIDTNFVNISPSIETNFSTDELGVHTIEGNGDLFTTIKADSQIEFEYNFTATQTTSSLVEIQLQLFNQTANKIIDTATSAADFSGSVSFYSGTRRLIGNVKANDVIRIRIGTLSGECDIEGKGLFIITAQQKGISTDKDIVSTTGFGNANTYGDLLFLKSEVERLQTLIENREIQVGEYSFSTTKPVYGTWEEISTEEGMGLLFGGVSGTSSTTSGEIKEHNHALFTSTFSSDNPVAPSTTSTIMRTVSSVGDNSYAVRADGNEPELMPTVGKSSSTGGVHNKAWGIKVGLKLWRRTA